MMTKTTRWISAWLVVAGLMAVGCTSLPQTAPPFEQPVAPLATLGVEVVDQATGAAIAGAAAKVHTQAETTATSGEGYASWVLPTSAEGYGLTVTAEGCREAFRSVLPFVENTHVRVGLDCPPPAPPEPTTPPLTPAAPPWRGRLSVPTDQRCFLDATGACQLPLIAHFGEAFSAYVRRPADVEAQLVAVKAAGYDGVRFWDTLGYYDSAWGGREVMPWRFTNKSGQDIEATPGYYEKLRDFLGLLKRLGLVAHHSRGDLNSASLDRVVAHAGRVADLYDAVGWDTLALFEGNNEDFQNGDFGPSGLRRIVDPARRRGAITASSCPAGCTEEGADVVAFSNGFSVRYYHGSRDGEPTDRLRHIFSTTRERPEGSPRLAWEGEPTGPNQFLGPGVTVNHVEDVEELALLAAERFLARGAWTYMSQYGVFWNGRIEQHAGFYAVPRLRAVLKAFAPDLMAWPTLTHGGRAEEAAFVSPTGYYGDPGVSSGPARIDLIQRADRRQVVATVHGGRGTKTVKNNWSCVLDVTVVAARPDETIQTDTFRLAPGETLAFEYRVGRLLLGQCR